MLTPNAVYNDPHTGMYAVELAMTLQPEGTTAVKLPGSIQGSIVRLEISEEDLDENGAMVLVALDDKLISLGTVCVRVYDKRGRIWAKAGLASGAVFAAGAIVSAVRRKMKKGSRAGCLNEIKTHGGMSS